MSASELHPAECFAVVLEAAGGSARRVRSPREAAGAIHEIATAQGVREILYAAGAQMDEQGLRLLLKAHGVDMTNVAESRDRPPHLRVAVTGAELAIAETGTILVGGQPGGWGVASVLPWVHIALLPIGSIVESLAEAFALFEPRLTSGEGDWVWITGPSRTADIGHTLVLGAHGPNALHVLVVE